MTSPARREHGHPLRRSRRPLLYLLGIAIPAAAITALTLDTASPSVPGRGFGAGSIHYDWWLLEFLLVIPVFLCALAHPRLTVAAIVIAGVPQFVVLHVFVERTNARPLDLVDLVDLLAAPILGVAAYTQAAVMTVLFGLAAMCGAVAARRPRPSPDRIFT